MPGGKLPEIFISTLEAGKLLGCGQQSIETGLRNGSFPIGWAWVTSEAGKQGKRGQWNYRIPRQALYRALEAGSLTGAPEQPGTYADCRLYRIWYEMHQRCENRNHPKYCFYGGRGVKVIFDWERYADFEKWAYASGYREYLILDRCNKNLDFMPENCRWTALEYKGEKNDALPSYA